MRLLLSITRWPAARASTLDAGATRPAVYPPSLVQPPAGGWDRVLFWLLAAPPRRAALRPPALPAVRSDFLQALADIDLGEAAEATRRVHEARSLRDLWHLRTVVHRLVALARTESEAEARLAHLNCHFPQRLPRAGLALFRKAA